MNFFEPPLGIEPRISDYKSDVIPFNYGGKCSGQLSYKGSYRIGIGLSGISLILHTPLEICTQCVPLRQCSPTLQYYASSILSVSDSTPGRTRTLNHQSRNLTFYPIELRRQFIKLLPQVYVECAGLEPALISSEETVLPLNEHPMFLLTAIVFTLHDSLLLSIGRITRCT